MNDTLNTDIGNLHQPETNSTDAKKAADEAWGQSQASENKDNNDQGQMLSELQAKYQELDDQYKRLWADQQNIIKRNQRERQDLIKYAAANTIEAILPALDNFEFAKKSINANTSHEEVIKSIDMLQEQLLMSLRSIGMTEIDTNQGFKAELHEAISKVQDPSKEEGTIVEILKKGFKLNDKILRVATVVVTTKE
jgi:molecular chaperone GrpE